MGECAINDIGIYTNIHKSGNKTKDGHKLYYATCKACGSTVEKQLSDIKRNHTKCYHKSGYIKSSAWKINDMPRGWINKSKLNKRIYDMWRAMIERTTPKYWGKYPCYNGTTVDEDWRILSNFVKDIQELHGYQDWVNSSNSKMMLDKDTIQYGNKHYSKHTCCFISHAASNQDVARRHPENIKKATLASSDKSSKPVRCTHQSTDTTLEFLSFKEACRALDLNHRNAWMALSDKYPYNHTTKGWTIEYIKTE